MAGLQRSSDTFRRSGSSGLVWEDKHLPGEMNKSKTKEEQENSRGLKQSQSVGGVGLMRRSRSNGGGAAPIAIKAYRTDQVAPAMDPPSPKVSCCSFFGDFSKSTSTQKSKAGRRR